MHYQVKLPSKVYKVYTFCNLKKKKENLVSNEIRMSNIEDDLIADLNAIDARREKLREALKKLKTTPQNTKSSLVPDSEGDVGQKIFDNSLDEFECRTPRNTGDRLGHMRLPEPGYTLYKDKQTEIFQKKKIIDVQVLEH